MLKGEGEIRSNKRGREREIHKLKIRLVDSRREGKGYEVLQKLSGVERRHKDVQGLVGVVVEGGGVKTISRRVLFVRLLFFDVVIQRASPIAVQACVKTVAEIFNDVTRERLWRCARRRPTMEPQLCLSPTSPRDFTPHGSRVQPLGDAHVPSAGVG